MLQYNVAFMSIILAISFATLGVSEATGFTIDLIHRRSLQSPSTTFEGVTDSIQRSFSRARVLSQRRSPQSPSVGMIPDHGEYLMRFHLGTPPVEFLAVADTGSDMTWIQCKPCSGCFEQIAPLFDSKQSSTYKPLSCSSSACKEFPSTSCNTTKNTCRYEMLYGDGSFSNGDLAAETITLGSTTGENVSFRNLIIGCGHANEGGFSNRVNGIFALGGGKGSLITQMRSTTHGKFSYCLVPPHSQTLKPSKLNFGDNAVVSGAGVVTTPMVLKDPYPYYILTLTGFSVGKLRLDYPNKTADVSSNDFVEGNIVIDSGTTLTLLPPELYSKIESALRSQIKAKPIEDPGPFFKLCYSVDEGKRLAIPEIIAHFKGGDVKLAAKNIFARTTNTSICLTLAESRDVAIYGNLAMVDLLIGYDLEKKTVSFKPTDCTKA
ncbi:hypothetical protein F511_02954 [Dorcoceras hygrometricum]|uniref:Peptidase A1 domain-containing protein n=1 Tax=Dorcoceras hygrometricum TaxID=472368 RepID=A0A2Z7AJY5_9LAMI|nr:hypothetical protein F511_02954 [Dorcoceras hygrometricum]